MSRDDREFDVLLWGATGWTGLHGAEYLAVQYPPEKNVKWGLAARSLSKLNKVKERLQKMLPDASWIEDIPLIVADATVQGEIEAAVQRTKVVATVVGPYAFYGEPLVKACLKYATDYCDITGEVQWEREMIDKYHAVAEEKGVLIIPGCGYDSIPADIGTFMMVESMEQLHGKKCKVVRGYNGTSKTNNRSSLVKGPKPLAGTLLSLVNALETGPKEAFLQQGFLMDREDKQSRSLIRKSGNQIPQIMFGYDSSLPRNNWTTHFPMSWINEKVVMRSSSLLRSKYGKRFQYHEAMACPNPFLAVFTTFFVVLFYGFLLLPFGSTLFKKVIPESSQFPPAKKKSYKPGYFEYLFVAESDDEKNPVQITGIFSGVDEAGYTETSKMLLESAICLATEKDKLEMSGGVLTPASAMGNHLIRRLQAKEMTIQILKK